MKISDKQFISLDREQRTHIPTADAAFHLNREPQTLRTWACFESGAIKPLRINGRLSWPVSAIRALLNEGA